MKGAHFRTTLACGGVPLAVGITIFLLWVVTRWKVLYLAGAVTLLAGLISFVTGVIMWRRYRLAAAETGVRPRAAIWLLLLLLANFPVAAGIIYAVPAIEFCYVLRVANGGAGEIERFSVHGGGIHAEYGPIAPGQSRARWLWFTQDGALEFEATRGGERIAGQVDYVSNNQGGSTVLTVCPDGTARVESGAQSYPKAVDERCIEGDDGV